VTKPSGRAISVPGTMRILVWLSWVTASL
jgi:hypothetical protein